MAFATVDDVQARMLEHTLNDQERKWVGVMLDDASTKLSTAVRVDVTDDLQADLLRMVACNMVIRAINPMLAQMTGVTQTSTTAGSYSQSMTFANATGDLYISREEKVQLGIIGGKYCYAEPYGGTDA